MCWQNYHIMFSFRMNNFSPYSDTQMLIVYVIKKR